MKPIKGDLLQENLGLSPENIELLEKKVNIVFHNAATIRFNEPLRAAIEMNVIAVRKILNLCRGFQNLEVII